MTNKERILEIERCVIAGLRSLLSSTLKMDNFEDLTKKTWGEATSALRSVNEAVNLLEKLVYIAPDFDVESLPLLSASSMAMYGSTFGNRCYWQAVAVDRWMEEGESEESAIADHRFDLDFDIVEETETKTETTTKTKKTRKRGQKVPIESLIEK